MAVPPELVWVIERLRSTPSKRERVRLLLQARDVVRAMSPQDRLAVARELGFDGAERFVEGVAGRGGFSAEPWLKMLDEVGEGGDEALGVVRGLLNPATRGASVSRLLDAASGWVADLDAYRPEPDSDGDTVANEVDERDAGVHGGGSDSPIDADGESLEIDREEPEGTNYHVDAEGPEPTRPMAAPAGPPPPGVTVERNPPGPAGSAEPESDGADVEGVEAQKPGVGEEDQAAIPSAKLDHMITMLDAATHSSRRLAILRSVLGEIAGADAETLEPLLVQFPEGWARRRAVETLFRAGIPKSAAEALELVDLLSRASERLWALTTLAASRELSSDESDRLLAAADSPALARRLSHRIQRSA